MIKIVLVALLCASALAARVALETDASVPAGWSQLGAAPRDQLIQLHFQLRFQNVDVLERVALDVSTPSSPMYGKHWTREQVDELTAPSAEAFDAVLAFVAAEPAVVSVDRTASAVSVVLPVEAAERMLATELAVFRHGASGKRLVRAPGAYSVPAELAESVAYVAGLKSFAHQRAATAERRERQSGVSSVDPSVIVKQYGTEGVSASAEGNSQAVAQFLGQYADSADLDEFFLLFARSALGNKPNWVGYDGWYAGLEASLDIQYIMSVGLDVNTTFWSMPNDNTTNYEPFYSWLLSLENSTDIPILWSVSYGEPEWAISSAYLQMVNTHFAKLAARGVTVFFASGDSGADCQPSGTQFAPDFPVSSPWVTAVGGTELVSGTEVCNALSGGGFSNVFGTPSWQVATVEAYLNSSEKKPARKFFNESGRAYPDVSALSAGFVIVIDLLPQPGIGGTSAASPTTAGVWALINDLRLAAGQAPLGFINPLLYASEGNGMTDITSGSNSGSNEGTACNGVGFTAVTGWDPATGWGSPQYEALAAMVSAL